MLALHPPYADPSTTMVLVGVRVEPVGVTDEEVDDEDDVVAIVLSGAKVERALWSGSDRRVERCTLCMRRVGDMHKVGEAVMDENVDLASMNKRRMGERRTGRGDAVSFEEEVRRCCDAY